MQQSRPVAYQIDVLRIPIKVLDNEHHLEHGLFRDGGYRSSKAKGLFSSIEFLESTCVVKLTIGLHSRNHARSNNCGDRTHGLDPGRPIEAIGRNENTRESKNYDSNRAKCVQRPKATDVSGLSFHSEILA